MTFDGAIIKEQGITFGIAVVKESVMNNSLEANKAVIRFQAVLRVAPTVLMAQDSQGNPRYYGRKDVVEFLANIDPGRIPWKRYTIS
jgi:hypothetical protein